jgi:hypothetical protein
MLGVLMSVTTKEAPVEEQYDGRQYVGIDLHRRRSVIVRMTPAGEQLGWVRRRASGWRRSCPSWSPRLRACGELDIDEVSAAALCRMSAATIDRRLAADRGRLLPHGRSHTKPGSLPKDAVPIRTWAEWEDAVPRFAETTWSGTRAATPPATSARP